MNGKDKKQYKTWKKSFSLMPSSNKNRKSKILEDSFLSDKFETNLQRMINSLNKIKHKLNLINDLDLAKEVDWMVDTLIKNQLNNIVINVDKETQPDKEEMEKMLELLAEFSGELYTQRNIESIQSAVLNKKEPLKNIIQIEEEQEEEEVPINDKCTISKEKLFNYRYDIFDSDFNIFNFVNEVGRDSTLLIIAGNAFNKFELMDKIDTLSFINFINEIKCGYLFENPYHNVY